MTSVLRYVALVVGVTATLATAEARQVRTAHFVIEIPGRGDVRRIGDALERAYRVVREYGLRMPPSIAVTIHRTTSEFANRSGAGRMHIAGVRARMVHLQPADVLERVGGLDRALTHELVHVAMLGADGRMPRWFSEGLAMNVAGERHPIEGQFATAVELDNTLGRARDHTEMRRAYGTAERLTRELIASVGRAQTLSAIRMILIGRGFVDAFKRAANLDVADWVGRQLQAQKSAIKPRQR